MLSNEIKFKVVRKGSLAIGRIFLFCPERTLFIRWILAASLYSKSGSLYTKYEVKKIMKRREREREKS